MRVAKRGGGETGASVGVRVLQDAVAFELPSRQESIMKGKSHSRNTDRSSGCNLRLYSQYLLFFPDCPVHFLLPAQSLEDRKIPICMTLPARDEHV